MTMAEAQTDLTAAQVVKAAKLRQRRATELRLLADDVGPTLGPLRVAAMRRAAELELSGAAFAAVAEGLGATTGESTSTAA